MSARALFQRVNPWRDLAGLPREVWILFLATLVNKAGTMVLPFLVLYLTRDLKLSLGTAGFVVTVYGAGALVAAPVSGSLSDRFGPIRVMRVSLLVSGFVLLLFPFARTLPAVLACTLLLFGDGRGLPPRQPDDRGGPRAARAAKDLLRG